MACNAVATVSAQISERNFTELLESEQGQKVLLMILKEKVGLTDPKIVSVTSRGIEVEYGKYGSIFISRNEVAGRYLSKWHLNQIADYVKDLTNALMKEKIIKILLKNGIQIDKQTVIGKNTVLNVRM